MPEKNTYGSSSKNVRTRPHSTGSVPPRVVSKNVRKDTEKDDDKDKKDTAKDGKDEKSTAKKTEYRKDTKKKSDDKKSDDKKPDDKKADDNKPGDKPADDKKDGDTPKPAKKAFTVNIGFSTVLTTCIVLACCILVAFVMGVMVGRGDNIEQEMAPLADFLPNDSLNAREQAAYAGSTAANSGVIYPEDLRYAVSLKARPDATLPASIPEQTAAPQPATPVPPPAIPAPETPTPAVVEAELPASPAPTIFDFIFQVATFKDEAPVDRLRATLEGKSLRTRMEKKGKLYMVMVQMRGTVEQAAALRQMMIDMKLGPPLQRSKKAVE